MALTQVEALERLELYCARHGWTRKKLDIELGFGWSAAKWSRVFQNKANANIEKSELDAIISFLDKQKFSTEVGNKITDLKKEKSDDHMYFSMLDFFGFSAETEVETKQLASGLYTLYRPSLKIPKMFTVGLVEVYDERSTHALKVKETRIFKGNIDESIEPYKRERGIKEFFEGYMIRKRRRYICIQRSMSADSPNFVISLYNDEFVDNEGHGARILSLGGVVFGTVGSRIYASRVYLERCEDGISAKDMVPQLTYVGEDELKPSVRSYLKLNSGSEFFQVF